LPRGADSGPAFVGRVLHKGNLRFPVSSSLRWTPP